MMFSLAIIAFDYDEILDCFVPLGNGKENKFSWMFLRRFFRANFAVGSDLFSGITPIILSMFTLVNNYVFSKF